MEANRRTVLRNFEKYEAYTEDKIAHGIEQNRKGYAYITVTDKNGKPVPGAQVHVRQKNHAFKFGANIFMLDELETAEKNEIYKNRFKELFNMATLPFYWSDLEPIEGQPRFAADSEKIYRRPAPDLCMDFCQKNGIEPREHALAYEHFFPDWLKGRSKAEVKRALEKRFAAIAERYADKIPTIEVTNEMFWECCAVAPFYHDADFVTWCFKLAEKYFPHNELVINEWTGIWTDSTTVVAYEQIIENALRAGARIDAIGMQYHIFLRRESELDGTRLSYDPRHVYKTMDRYSHFGKPLQITEVTIPAYSNDPADEQLQMEILTKLYKIWFSHPNVEQIIYWNLVDGYAAFAPQGDMTAGENYYFGGLLRFDMSEKPAYKALKQLICEEWHTEETTTADENGRVGFKGFFGDYDITVTVDGKEACATFPLQRADCDEWSIVI